ncbi:hypothetical protein FOZ63_032282 [Perkinsus olseni]|uniref:Uncharacterized protein n=1 Tax=Perkinsus olseni TaxID=32597 RepID=A0A7J6S4X7_PEROL|nr:hypothetical protein FOZ63_032282 [Perkinsus olseni]
MDCHARVTRVVSAHPDRFTKSFTDKKGTLARIGVSWRDADPFDRRAQVGYVVDYVQHSGASAFGFRNEFYIDLSGISLDLELERNQCVHRTFACVQLLKGYLGKRFYTERTSLCPVAIYGTKVHKQAGPMRFVTLRWNPRENKLVPYEVVGSSSKKLPALLDEKGQWERLDELRNLVDEAETVDVVGAEDADKCSLQLRVYGEAIYEKYKDEVGKKHIKWEGLTDDEDKTDAAAAMVYGLLTGWQ